MPPKNSETKDKEDPAYFRRKTGNYSLLDENGIIKPRQKTGATVVKKGDVIIGKVVVIGNKAGEERKIDASVVIQAGEEGTIDRVHTIMTPSGYKLVKVVIRVTRIPTLGDKFASRSAQKGTCGMMYRQEDMPFTSSGIVPDIIMNPLAIPSRMTINQLIECALGKECVMKGEFGDATPFTEESVDVADKFLKRVTTSDVEDGLKRYGFQAQGWETMYNGMTGEMMNAKIFIGPTYYQRLKHMVDDKMHARARGNITVTTRQALEGLVMQVRVWIYQLKEIKAYKKWQRIFLSLSINIIILSTQMDKYTVCNLVLSSRVSCQMEILL